MLYSEDENSNGFQLLEYPVSCFIEKDALYAAEKCLRGQLSTHSKVTENSAINNYNSCVDDGTETISKLVALIYHPVHVKLLRLVTGIQTCG